VHLLAYCVQVILNCKFAPPLERDLKENLFRKNPSSTDLHNICVNEVTHNSTEFRATIAISFNIIFFSTIVTIKMHALTRYDTTNLRRVSKTVTHAMHLHEARRSVTTTATSIDLENTLITKRV
jgi:hypothetical protein